MAKFHFHQTTTATPEQFISGLTDFGPGRSELFENSADDYLKVHDQGPAEADLTEGSGGIWERLHYDWLGGRIREVRQGHRSAERRGRSGAGHIRRLLSMGANSGIDPHFRAIDGVRVRYAKNEGPPERTVLLTSPWPESVYAFAPIWSSLAEHARLVAIDLPGFGHLLAAAV